MERNQPVTAKRVWNVMRVVFFMLRKGISKRKLVFDLEMVLKRGKNLLFHAGTGSGGFPGAGSGLREYEFSCSNTPSYSFPFNKKKHHNSHAHGLFACAHAPLTHVGVDAAAVMAVLDMLNGENSGGYMTAAPSPCLPGFVRTPKVRPLRITDSPFPLREEENDDNGLVDRAAEEFIERFYKDLKKQKIMVECS